MKTHSIFKSHEDAVDYYKYHSVEAVRRKRLCHPDACPMLGVRRGEIEMPNPALVCQRCKLPADHTRGTWGNRRI